VFVCGQSAGLYAQSNDQRVRAVRVERAPTIDGRLDDAVWSSAEAIANLTQVDPREGAHPTELTEVRILFDSNALYVGIRCFDREPASIIATQMQRDSDLQFDDRVAIALDTFHDHRNGYYFAMNPAGAKVDSLISGNGKLNQAWDGIWEGRASIDDLGWSVEIAIPFETVAFNAALSSWGFNVQRSIKRRLESDRWAGARRNYQVAQVSEAGELEGLEGLHQGLGLDLVPFFVTRWTDERDDADLTGKPGFDLFYRLSPSMGAALTVHTDFADTEVDEHRINLTRFPLFFPEKRDFFLQDAGIFQFADLGQDLIPFFSRRIGLTDAGEEVPILAGAKVTGRAADYDVGVLDVETESSHGFEPANLFVTRISKNVGDQSSVGGIVTSGDPNGVDSNSLIGLDANLGVSDFLGDRNLRASVWALKSFDEGPASDDAAFGASIAYPNDVWQWSIAAKEIEKNFDPALGFVPRKDIRKYDAELQYQPRLNSAVRWLEFGLEPTVVTDLQDRLESASVAAQFFGVVMDSGDELHLFAIPTWERLDQPFDITDDVTIASGDYQWLRWRAESETALKRPVSLDAALELGDFYDGTRTDTELLLAWRPSAHFGASVGYEQSQVDLPDGAFVTHLGTARVNAAFSPDLTWSNLLQFDNESDTLGWNSRLQWLRKPGEQLILVFNHTIERTGDGSLITQSQGVALKLQYTLRF
jgi:hypothetical protein